MGEKIIIIGGGPAGIEAAMAAVRGGGQVSLISDGPVGGRSGWHSLLPSKVWLDAAAKLDQGRIYHLGSAPPKKKKAEVQGVIRRIQEVKERWHAVMQRELHRAGVTIVQGTAAFKDAHTLSVRLADSDQESQITGDKIIIATGSVPVFPPGLKPDGKQVIAPRFASHLDDLPDGIIVIGAGPTGCETAYQFNRLGVYVTWIVDQYGILPDMHIDLGVALGISMARQGVHLIQGQMVDRLEREPGGVTAVLTDGARYEAPMAFVATGRRGDWSRLDLGAAGLQVDDSSRVAVNLYGQTNVSHIYLVGDADGGAMVANKALAQGRIAGLHAAGLEGPAYDENIVPLVVYTDPEVAQVGDVSPEAGKKRVRIPFDMSMKAHILAEEQGFIEIAYAEADQRVLGGMAVGPMASSVLTTVAVVIGMKGTLDDLRKIYPAHPTLMELPFTAARAVS